MTMPYDAHLVAVVPHMHWLGSDFVMTAERPDGTEQTLIRVDRWDFNWQDTYDFAEPVSLPRGTIVRMVAHFDNSAGNPANPSDPPKDVSWGEQTTDEMCIGFMQLTRDDEHLRGSAPGEAALPVNLEGAGGPAERAAIMRLREALRREAELRDGVAPR